MKIKAIQKICFMRRNLIHETQTKVVGKLESFKIYTVTKMGKAASGINLLLEKLAIPLGFQTLK